MAMIEEPQNPHAAPPACPAGPERPGMAPAFISLLFPAGAEQPLQSQAPACFIDLNLDQLMAELAGAGDPYDLLPLLYTPAQDRATIAHRHAVFRDLERPAVAAAVDALLEGLERVARLHQLSGDASHPHEQGRWLLDALQAYGEVVAAFTDQLQAAGPASDGFRALAGHLRDVVAGTEFQALRDATRERLAELAALRYDLLIAGLRVEVSRHDAQAGDWGQDIAATFARFQSGKADPSRGGGQAAARRQALRSDLRLNTVEERILTQLVQLYPEPFARIAAYVQRYSGYAEPVLTRVARELQFFLRYRRYIAPLRDAGQAFCYPALVAPGAHVVAEDACDLVLAHHLLEQRAPSVTNDFALNPPERLLLVSGPNQGGKTTFARMFGQLHYLARLGLPLPARSATLLWWQGLYTHFERAEDIRNLHGKLEDDLVRMHAILQQVRRDSVVIMNEIFSSTTTDDARWLGQRVLRQLLDLGALGVCVTFIDELARMDPAVVSMASTVDPEDPAIRTFRVVRKPPDGKAFARALAAKHHLTRADLEARL